MIFAIIFGLARNDSLEHVNEKSVEAVKTAEHL